MTRLVLGTRGSELALAQTRIVSEKLAAAHAGIFLETRSISTTGDERLDVSLSAPGILEKGLFTRKIEDALRDRSIDAAVHSLKDLPVEDPAGLVLGAIIERGDPGEALVSKQAGGWRALPPGARVATSSPRRKAQLTALRGDLKTTDIRGNVPTRLRKLAVDPEIDAILLAKAGLDRLGPGCMPAGLHVTGVPEILPAPGQGAIAVQCRAGDDNVLRLLAAIHHEETARCVRAEREFLRSLGGGCSSPAAALATIENGELKLRTFQVGSGASRPPLSS